MLTLCILVYGLLCRLARQRYIQKNATYATTSAGVTTPTADFSPVARLYLFDGGGIDEDIVVGAVEDELL
jgi:hypothetical protein